ncbi:MAG: cell division protein SepF [Bacilli bacterium]|nr:cell division protein SepF [Bacilli bacterium]MDD4077655.1 cell division protein SepF [Bacilli bacterium]MDD4388202.1 cell division protein SepF [Bacilli bacterium]
MGFLKKKKTKRNKIEFSEYNKHKAKGGKNYTSLLTSFDRMEYQIVTEDSKETLLKICDIILSGRAVLANFDKIDTEAANEMLSFISGVVYAKEGEIYKLDKKLFLFGRKEEFEDGSLYQYVEDTKDV